MFSKCQFPLKDGVLIFWGNPHGIQVNSEYSQELCWTMNDLGLWQHLPHFKERPDDFYPLLRSIAFTWIHIGVKRISQACCLHHLKNMEKNCKTQLWDEKQNRALFFGSPCRPTGCKSTYRIFFRHHETLK